MLRTVGFTDIEELRERRALEGPEGAKGKDTQPVTSLLLTFMTRKWTLAIKSPRDR